jgi:hypothetical protein
MLLESATPLSAELAAKIDTLLRSRRAAEAGSDSQTRC